jgi:pimeloyl-ACP methyl ester carboxylesterase
VFAAMTSVLALAGLDYRGGYVDVGGIETHYLDYGPTEPQPEPMPPVFLVHGGGAGAAVWFRQIAALSRRHRVIAPDNPLFGLSGQVTVPAPIEDFSTRFLAGFMDALGITRGNFAGMSLGASGALFLAMRHPERVARVALLDSVGFGKEAPWVFRLVSVPLLGHVFTTPIRPVFDRYFEKKEVRRGYLPGAREYKRYAFAIHHREGHAGHIRRSMKTFADVGGQTRVFADDELASVRVPTMIIWGEEDRFFPVSHARRAHEMIPGATLHILPGAGHVTPWDASEEVSGLLEGFFAA